LVVTFLLLSLLGAGLPGAQAAALLELAEFERLYTDARTTPPLREQGAWTKVQLRDIWGLRTRRAHSEAWYSTDFELPETPDEAHSLFVPRAMAAASFWINDTEIGTTGAFVEPLPRLYNQPLLFTVPRQLLHAGTNRLDIRLVVVPNQIGWLSEMTLGPTSVLGPIHGRAYFARVTAMRLMTAVMLTISLLVVIFHFTTKTPPGYLWFALGCVAWSVFALEFCVREIPIASQPWTAIQLLSLMLASYFFSRSLHFVLSLERPRLEWSLLVMAVVTSVLAFVVRPIAAGTIFTLTLLFVIGLTVYFSILMLLRRERVTGKARSAVVAGSIAALGLLGFNAYAASSNATILVPTFPYIPFVVLLLGANLFLRMQIRRVRRTENFEAERAAAMRSAVDSERERLMREIHDGVGGQLASTLAQLQLDPSVPSSAAHSLQEAMTDLRLIVHSLDSTVQPGDITTILATVRERFERGLNEQGIAFDWRVEPLPPLEGFGSEQALQLMRILQEAFANVVSHAGATCITLRSGETAAGEQPGVFVEIADDGKGFAVGAATAGHGLRNMHARAERLGGKLDVTSDERGTRLNLWIPATNPQVLVMPATQ
jgi:signal transduction histidine kinase